MNLLFRPKVTLASLIALSTVSAAQVVVIIAAKPLFAALLGVHSADMVVDILGKVGAACGLATVFLGVIAAYGRSPAPAVDNYVTPPKESTP